MVNEYGLVVECAYNNLQKKLNKEYKATFDQQMKNHFMLKAFDNFLKDIRSK